MHITFFQLPSFLDVSPLSLFLFLFLFPFDSPADQFEDSKDVSVDGVNRRSHLEGHGRDRLESYVMYEGNDGEGEKFLHVQRKFLVEVLCA